jgi:hypothetical protein
MHKHGSLHTFYFLTRGADRKLALEDFLPPLLRESQCRVARRITAALYRTTIVCPGVNNRTVYDATYLFSKNSSKSKKDRYRITRLEKAGGPASDFLNHFLQWLPRSSRSLRRAGTMPMVSRDFCWWNQRNARAQIGWGERI